MNNRSRYLILLIFLWAIFGLVFLCLGFTSLDLTIWLFSAEYSNYNMPEWATSMIFFMTFTETMTLIVFGCIFLVFSCETYKCKPWAWNAGVIISTIFVVIFSFLLASLIVSTLLFKNEFTITALVITTITFLIDLGIVFLITRPSVKICFENKKGE